MTIIEAIEVVRGEGGRIRRTSWKRFGTVQVDGKRFRDARFFWIAKDHERRIVIARHWKPMVADLIADDWEVIRYGVVICAGAHDSVPTLDPDQVHVGEP